MAHLRLSISEAQLTEAVIEAAHTFGWLVHHDRPARTDNGWRTAIQGDAGFPDLALVHPTLHVATFSELKAGRGKPTTMQRAWLDACSTVERPPDTFLWTVEDWHNDTVLSYLADPLSGVE